jgi:hypothetical protein
LSVLNGTDSIQLILGNNTVQFGATGTTALPSVYFRNDPDTGFSFGTNILNISAGGTLISEFSLTRGVVFSASVAQAYTAQTATYTATALDYFINCTANTFTVNLPTAIGITGRIYVIKNSGAGVITADPAGSQTIDGSTTLPIAAAGVLRIASNGANWFSF